MDDPLHRFSFFHTIWKRTISGHYCLLKGSESYPKFYRQKVQRNTKKRNRAKNPCVTSQRTLLSSKKRVNQKQHLYQRNALCQAAVSLSSREPNQDKEMQIRFSLSIVRQKMLTLYTKVDIVSPGPCAPKKTKAQIKTVAANEKRTAAYVTKAQIQREKRDNMLADGKTMRRPTAQTQTINETQVLSVQNTFIKGSPSRHGANKHLQDFIGYYL